MVMTIDASLALVVCMTTKFSFARAARLYFASLAMRIPTIVVQIVEI